MDISFGSIKSPTDYRDIGLAQLQEPREYPSKFMNNLNDLPVWHQRKIGSCVGHAFAKYKQKLDKDDTGVAKNLSPRFIYALAKCRDKYDGEGTYPRLVASILKDIGCATEDTCPNDTTLTHEEYVYNRKESNITDKMLEDAKQAKISGYAFVDITLNGLKQAIVDFKGCSLLVQLGSEWFTDNRGNTTWDGNKILPLRPPEKVISGHQIYLYGYEEFDGDTRFYFRNSWSSTWGQLGDGYFLWSEYKNYIQEGVTIVDIPDQLLKEVNELPMKFKHKFTTPLKYGDTGEEVMWLQRALKIEGLFNVSITGGYYELTKRAVFEFQKKYCTLTWWERNITRGSLVGPKTLEALNKKYE